MAFRAKAYLDKQGYRNVALTGYNGIAIGSKPKAAQIQTPQGVQSASEASLEGT
jgi:hypothetical protein